MNARPHYEPTRRIKLRPSEQQRFWTKVKVTPGCWEWSGYVGSDGYGRFKVGGRSRKAHRVAWEYVNGPVGDAKLFACHGCDNKACVRPGHIWLGTNGDNQRDYARKFGATNPNPVVKAKVTPKQCALAQQRWAAGETSAGQLGDYLDVAPSTAWHHATGKCKCAERTGH